MEILTLIAILAGPVIAIQIQKLLERKREERERRLKVFKTLMVTRGTILSPSHVEALNSIDIEFNSSEQKDKDVRIAWKAYLDHLNTPLPEKQTDDDRKRWNEKTLDLLIELLYEMSKAVGYDYDRTYIKRTAYTPIRYGDLENQNDFIRHSLVEIFLGKKKFPIEISSTGASDENLQEKLQRLMIDHYENSKPIRVEVVQNKN